MRTQLALLLAMVAGCGSAATTDTTTTAVEPAEALNPKADSTTPNDWMHVYLASGENIQVALDYQIVKVNVDDAEYPNATPVWINVTGVNGRTLDANETVRAVITMRYAFSDITESTQSSADQDPVVDGLQLDLTYADNGRYTALVPKPLALEGYENGYNAFVSLVVDGTWQDFPETGKSSWATYTTDSTTSHDALVDFDVN